MYTQAAKLLFSSSLVEAPHHYPPQQHQTPQPNTSYEKNKFKLNTLASISISNTILALLCGMADHKLLTLNTKLFAQRMLLSHFYGSYIDVVVQCVSGAGLVKVSLSYIRSRISKNTLIINTTTYAAAPTCPHIQL